MSDHSRRQAWLIEAILIAGLILLPLLFWWQLWAPSPAERSTLPEGDFSGQYYPLQLFAARELAEAKLPAWNPYLNAGQPGLADIQTGFFYPPNLLLNLALRLLGVPYGLGTLTAQVVLHFSLASLFTYLFVRHLARRAGARRTAARGAGLVAALSFTYSGYLTSFPVQQPTILETAVWLPLVLLFLDRTFFHARPAPQVILAALALACALLAGHPQTAMHLVYATAAYGLFLIGVTRKDRHPAFWQSILTGGVKVGLVLALAVALAAVQLAPTLEFIARSTRAGMDYGDVAWGFPLAEITHLLYPGYFGGSPQYVGILPLILAAAALLVRRVRRDVIFWLFVGAAAFVLAFGQHTFLYNVAYLLAPGFAVVRNQERIIYLFGFAISVLAGYGSLLLMQPVPPRERKGYRRFARAVPWVWAFFAALTALWYYGYLLGEQQGVEVNLFAGVLRHHTLILLILGGSAILFALRLRGRLRRGWLAALALLLIALNLFTVNWRYNLAEPVAGGAYPESGLVAFLREQPGTFRISSAGLLPGGSGAGSVYELEDITGNTPMRLDGFQQFEDRVGSWQRWQLLNVRYVLSQRDLDGPGLERVYEEGEVKIYRMGDPLPRAWVVPQTVSAEDGQAFDLLNQEGFDPRTTAVVGPGEGVGAPSEAEYRAARVVDAAPGRLVLEVTATGEGLLVISQPFYPGWQAQVDGAPARLVRTNILLQGVPIGRGEHLVVVEYQLSVWPGLISLATLGMCLASLALGRRARAA